MSLLEKSQYLHCLVMTPCLLLLLAIQSISSLLEPFFTRTKHQPFLILSMIKVSSRICNGLKRQKRFRLFSQVMGCCIAVLVKAPLKKLWTMAVGWSPDGEFIAIARKNLVNILSSKFEEMFSISLSFKSLLDDSNVKYVIKVDAVRWIRPDCIIVGCLQVNDDNEEEEKYAVQVITSENGRITNRRDIGKDFFI